MNTRKPNTRYQYEPLVTPSEWKGDEQRFAVRLKGILDDLYQKVGTLRNRPQGPQGGGVSSVNGVSPDENGDVRISASDVGALPSSGTASNASKLSGQSLAEIMLAMHPVGSIYTTSSASTSPADIIGGEWEVQDKVFANKTLSSGFFTAGRGVSVSSQYAIIAGHTIRFRVTVSYNAELGDASVVLGTVNWSQLGLTGGNYLSTYLTGVSDGGNGLSLATIDSSTGVLTHTDCVTKISGGTIAANQPVNFCLTTNSDANHMLNSFCDQFVWCRTS